MIKRHVISLERFKALLEKYPFGTVHSFRHTHATQLIENGASAKGVAERLGHADATITQNLYTHNTQKLQEETAAISVSQSDEADSIRNEEEDAAERLSDSELKTAPHKNGVPLKCRQLLFRITGIAFCLFCVLSVGLSSAIMFFLLREASEAREDARQLKQVIEIIEKTSLAVRSENALEADIGIAQLRECKNADSVRNAVALFEQLSHGETEMESDVVTSTSMSFETGES